MDQERARERVARATKTNLGIAVMNTASIAARAEVASSFRARAASVRNWLVSTRCALLACAALWIAYATRVAIDAGPYHLFELVFLVGAVMLVTGIAWYLPFFGAMIFCAASVATWIFLDATPINAWLASPAFVVSCLLLHRWQVERTATAS